MKILIVGCSLSYGSGFPLEVNDPQIWPNQLKKKLKSSITNISVPGYDNTGIFLNAADEMFKNHYNLVLVQLSVLNRVVVSPNMHGRILVSQPNINYSSWTALINKQEYNKFFQIFYKFNGNFEHWLRLVKIITTLENIAKATNQNLKFINGMLNWDQEFFNNYESKFANELIDADSLPDSDIATGLKIINKEKEKINLDLWIDPYRSLYNQKVDDVSISDDHPGPASHTLYTDIILKNL